MVNAGEFEEQPEAPKGEHAAALEAPKYE